MRQPPANLGLEIALDDLRVVEVHLHAQVRDADLLANRVRLPLRVEEVAGHVARVDRLDHDRHVLHGGLLAGEAHVALVRAQPPRPLGVVGALRQHPGHHVDSRTAQRLREAQRRDHAGRELVLASRQRRQAPVAGFPAAGRRVDQHDVELVLRDARRDLPHLEVVAERELDRTKARLRRLAEGLESRLAASADERLAAADIRRWERRTSPAPAAPPVPVAPPGSPIGS